ncbi:MAG TPA: prepilin-type N-terminal cleavage/methylation domain-containing protein [Permianibacter sp.]|nr:prepilin-type N-terminal cleavage/methylation domain-containing protein [Permianibacter sp.]
MMATRPLLRTFGFTLVEIAVVLAIITVLLVIVAQPLASQLEQRRTEETMRQLELIKEAVYGFALSNGRLPCPATAASGGSEKFGVGGNSSNGICEAYAGLVPALTLGINPVDENGFAVDAWGVTANRVRYAVSNRDIASGTPAACTATVSKVMTANNGIRNASMPCLSDAGVNLITVCSVTPTGIAGAATGCTTPLSTKAPFVVFSLGKNAPTGGIDTDEAHNVDVTDAYFVSHTRTSAGTAAGEFDDIVTWGSLNTLFSRMVQAGKLP